MTGYVVHEGELEAERGNGDTAARAVAIDSSNGSSVLELHLVRYGPGRSSLRTLEGVQEIMYTTSGSGLLAVAGEVVAQQLGGLGLVPGRVDRVEPDQLLQELGDLVPERHSCSLASSVRRLRACQSSG